MCKCVSVCVNVCVCECVCVCVCVCSCAQDVRLSPDAYGPNSTTAASLHRAVVAHLRGHPRGCAKGGLRIGWSLVGQDMGCIRPAKSGLTRQSFTRVVFHKGVNASTLLHDVYAYHRHWNQEEQGGGGGGGLVFVNAVV